MISLTKKLTKKIGHTTIVSVEPKKEEKKEEEKKEEEKTNPYNLYTPPPYQYYVEVEVPRDNNPCCTLM